MTQAAIPTEVGTPIHVRKLGHVVLRVADVERSTRFWTDIVGFTVSDRNEQGMVFLRCATDHHTIALAPAREIIPLPDKARGQRGFDHLALEVSSVSEFLRIREFLRSRGVPITFEGRRGPGSNPGIELVDPDGYQIEVYASMDQIGADGRSRPASEWRRASSLEEALANPLPGVTYQ